MGNGNPMNNLLEDLDAHIVDPFCAYLTSSGEFQVWNAQDVMKLRTAHRLIGKCSGVAGPRGSSGVLGGANRLPLRLSLVEVCALLQEGVLSGIILSRPITDPHVLPPSSHQLDYHHACLKQNKAEYIEMRMESLKKEKLPYYEKLITGQTESVPVPEHIRFSEQDDEQCPPRKKVASEIVPFEEWIAPSLKKTRDMLEKKSVDDFVLHQVQPTTDDLKRQGESELLQLPFHDAEKSVRKISEWLIGLQTERGVCFADRTLAIHQCIVFHDLWAVKKAGFLTCGAAKLGGTFLVYEDDPIFVHACRIITVVPSEKSLSSDVIASRLRISNSVKKQQVFASVSDPCDKIDAPRIHYTTCAWHGVYTG